MKRSTLISDLAIRYKYLNHPQVEKMVELVFKHLANALSQDQRIEIRGIGTWHVKTRKPRLARNPRTGEKVQVGIKKNIAFRMAKDLKFRINSNTSPAEIDKKIETNKYIYGVKFGLEFFCSKGGREAIKKFKNKNVKIFLDLKLKDIPNTVYKAIRSLKDVNPDYLTIHASGGLEMMRAAKKAQSETNKKLKILAVTILTSLTNKDLKQMGSNSSVETQVEKLAQTAKLAKIHGIVCSAHEIKKVRKVSKSFEIVVPGIRISNKVQDQKRVMSPKQALKLGATHLVIGRDITKGNPKTNIKKVLNALI